MTNQTIQKPAETDNKTADQHDERALVRSIARKGLRKLLFDNPNYKSLFECGQVIPERKDGSTVDVNPNGKVSIGGVIRCGNKQACPTCAAIGRVNDTAVVAWRANQQLKAGRGLSMLTLAPRHALGEALDPQIRCLNESFHATMRAKKVKDVLAEYGYQGHAKVLESPNGANGWHPHLHILLFHRDFIDVEESEEQLLKYQIWETFNIQLAKWADKAATKSKKYITGLDGKRRKETNREYYDLPDTWRKDASWDHGIDYTPIKPDHAAGTKIAAYCGKIQLEMTRGDLKVGRKATSRSIFQIMYDYGKHKNPQDAAIILEFLAATKGMHLVSWSKHFKGKNPLHGDMPEDFYEKVLNEHAEAQGLDTTGEKTTVAGIAPNLHRLIDRTDHKATGNPLFHELKTTYQRTQSVDSIVQLLNEQLPGTVIVDHDTPNPYPILRAYALEPPSTREQQAAEHKALLAHIRKIGSKKRTKLFQDWLDGLELYKQLNKHNLTN